MNWDYVIYRDADTSGGDSAAMDEPIVSDQPNEIADDSTRQEVIEKLSGVGEKLNEGEDKKEPEKGGKEDKGDVLKELQAKVAEHEQSIGTKDQELQQAYAIFNRLHEAGLIDEKGDPVAKPKAEPGKKEAVDIDALIAANPSLGKFDREDVEAMVNVSLATVKPFVQQAQKEIQAAFPLAVKSGVQADRIQRRQTELSKEWAEFKKENKELLAEKDESGQSVEERACRSINELGIWKTNPDKYFDLLVRHIESEAGQKLYDRRVQEDKVEAQRDADKKALLKAPKTSGADTGGAEKESRMSKIRGNILSRATSVPAHVGFAHNAVRNANKGRG